MLVSPVTAWHSWIAGILRIAEHSDQLCWLCWLCRTKLGQTMLDMRDMRDMLDKFRLKFLQISNEEKHIILPIWKTVQIARTKTIPRAVMMQDTGHWSQEYKVPHTPQTSRTLCQGWKLLLLSSNTKMILK